MTLKNYFALTGIILLFHVNIFSQDYNWTVADPNLQTAARYDDISFVTPFIGWAVNSNGQIYKTTNGGESWTKQKQASVYFRSVKFADTLNGWAGTLNAASLLFHTTNGGNNWDSVTNLPSLQGQDLKVCGLSVVSKDIVYGSGAFNGPPVILKTTNAGESWQLIDMKDYATNLIDCYFINKDSGFVVGGSPNAIFDPMDGTTKAVILFTSDGGTTWVNRYTSSIQPEWGWKINFPSSDTGYVSVENFFSASVVKTVDGGVTWTNLLLNIRDMADLEGIGFVNGTTGWACARENERITTNGGQTWSPVDIGKQINRFQFFGDTLGYASGNTIYKYIKQSPSEVKQKIEFPKTFFLSQNYPNPFNPSTTIEYTLPQAGRVMVRIYDGLGQEFRTILDTEQSSGKHSVVWDGKDADEHTVSSGPYIYRIDSGDNAESKMMILLK